MRGAILLLTGAALAGCATTAPVQSWPAVEVFAKAETDPVGTSNADAADDPAIWRNPADPAKSLIVGTDKKAGLYVYGLDGKTRDFDGSGRLNNVDLMEVEGQGVVVVASDRNDLVNAHLRLFRLDTEAAKLLPLGVVDGGKGEAYGLCLGKIDGELHAFSALKDGTVEEFRIDFEPALHSTPVSTRKIQTQIEGCVVDPRNGTLYVGEEDVGIWRFAKGVTTGEVVAKTDNLQLVADVEGLALFPVGESDGYLVASSQGDSAYAVYRLPDMAPTGRFRIAAGTLGSTEETDGITLASGSFGPDYPNGLFVAQDGQNAPKAQNFKLVSWVDVLAAIGSQQP